MGFEAAKINNEQVKSDRVIVRKSLELQGDTLTAAGAVSIVTPVTYLVTSGAIAITLANGYEGQEKTIIMVTDGGTATLTPANYAHDTTITFDTALEVWRGIFHAGTWYNIGTPTTS